MVVGQAVDGTQGLVIKVLIALVVVGTIVNAGLLTSGSASENATLALEGNMTTGVNTVSAKIPTLFNIAILVVILAFLAFLVQRTKASGGGASL